MTHRTIRALLIVALVAVIAMMAGLVVMKPVEGSIAMLASVLIFGTPPALVWRRGGYQAFRAWMYANADAWCKASTVIGVGAILTSLGSSIATAIGVAVTVVGFLAWLWICYRTLLTTRRDEPGNVPS